MSYRALGAQNGHPPPSSINIFRTLPWILRPRDDVGGPAGRGRTLLFLPPPLRAQETLVNATAFYARG